VSATEGGSGDAPDRDHDSAAADDHTQPERRAKLARLREAGVNPFPRTFDGRVLIDSVYAAHDPEQLEAGEQDGLTHRIAGRVTARRGHGKNVFLDVRDKTGTIQVLARLDDLGEEAFERVVALDIGDVVGIDGEVYVTPRKQLVLRVLAATMLAKSLRTPPDLYHGLHDPETRFRQRELDLMANERSREIVKTRARVLAAIREHMNARGFVELETPILQRLPGGASSRPFTTHHNALDRELYLRPSTELYLKRVIVGGFEDVYELGKFFRNEGISRQHNPEFTMLEWFVGGTNYQGPMKSAEELVADVAQRVLGTTKVERDGQVIDLAAPWKRVPLRDAIRDIVGIDILEADTDALIKALDEDVPPAADWAWLVTALQSKYVEPTIVQPTYLIDLPTDIWPLVKAYPEHPQLCEAFDGIVAGMEIVGGGTDINDPDEPQPLDEEFVRALEYGMLPASGVGLGIDRLMMILTGVETLREVVLFPAMRETTS
jgi:lysyl-tRNA synthetase class 2